MSISLSKQQQVFAGLPQSIVDAASSGGISVNPGFVFNFTNPGDSSTGTFSWSDNGDLVQSANDNWLNGSEVLLDLSNVTQARLAGKIVQAGHVGATLAVHYSLDGATFTDDLTTPAIALPFDALGWVDSGWLDLSFTEGLSNVYLRFWGANGAPGVTWGQADPLYLQFR